MWRQGLRAGLPKISLPLEKNFFFGDFFTLFAPSRLMPGCAFTAKPAKDAKITQREFFWLRLGCTALITGSRRPGLLEGDDRRNRESGKVDLRP